MNTVELILKHVDIIRNIFLKEGGWKYTRSLYLIGGFARGEETCDIVKGKLRIYNDLDILVIVRNKNLRSLYQIHRIQKIINDGRFAHQIDLVVESEDELRKPASTIQIFDIQKHHKWLWGQRFFEIQNITQFSEDSVSMSDALQLLFNRQASLLVGFAELRKPRPNVPYLQVQLSKPLFAMMAALLIAQRKYVVRVHDQLELIKAKRLQHRKHPIWQAIQDDDVMSLLQTAVEFKHYPKPMHFRPYDQAIEPIAKYYHDFLTTFMAYHYGLPFEERSLSTVIHAFWKHQPVQVDFFSKAWWVYWLRCREAGLRARFPSSKPHPQVRIYIDHLLWMFQYLTHETPDWQSVLSESQSAKLETDLDTLINAWKVSGYGCKIK